MAIRVFNSTLVCFWLVLTAGYGFAFAQNHALDDGVPVVDQGKEITLDELYDQLAKQTKAVKAKRIEKQIRQKWLESSSDTVNLFLHWSTIAIRENDLPRALDALEYVISMKPDFAEGWSRQASIYYQQKQFSRSLTSLRRAIILEPRHFQALSGLATLLQSMDKNEAALEAWYQVLKVYPANQDAQKAVIDLEEKLAGKRA